jgi:hypothetical protein
MFLEGQIEDLDKEVDGIARQITLGPAPIGFFDDGAGKGGRQGGIMNFV